MKKHLARIILGVVAGLSLPGCETVAVTGYLATNAHIETEPEGIGVCLGLPFVNKEVCVTVQDKNPAGDIGVGNFPFFNLGEGQRMARLEANRDAE